MRNPILTRRTIGFFVIFISTPLLIDPGDFSLERFPRGKVTKCVPWKHLMIDFALPMFLESV
jgi:hypothetical protein